MNKIFKKQFSKAFAITSAILMAADTLAPNKIKANNNLTNYGRYTRKESKSIYPLIGFLALLTFFLGVFLGRRNTNPPEGVLDYCLKNPEATRDNIRKVFIFLTKLEPGERLSEKLSYEELSNMYSGAFFVIHIATIIINAHATAGLNRYRDLIHLMFAECKSVISQSYTTGDTEQWLLYDAKRENEENGGVIVFGPFESLAKLVEQTENLGQNLTEDLQIEFISFLFKIAFAIFSWLIRPVYSDDPRIITLKHGVDLIRNWST